MSAYRYWRLRLNRWVGGGAVGRTGDVSVGLLTFQVGGDKQPTSFMTAENTPSPYVATASSAIFPDGAPWYALSNGSYSAWMPVPDGNVQWLKFDAGAAYDFDTIKLRCLSYSGSSDYILDFDVAASSTGAFAGEEVTCLDYVTSGDTTGVWAAAWPAAGAFALSTPATTDAALVAPMAAISAASTTGGVANAALLAPMATISAAATTATNDAALLAPMATISAAATTGGVATAALAPPKPTVTATGSPDMSVSTAALAPPTPIVFGTVVILENGISFGPPAPTMQAFGGLTGGLTAPSPTLAITGTFRVSGKASLAPPTPTLSATGKGGTAGSTGITAPMASLVGYGGAVCSVTIGAATLQATGRAGSVGNATLTAPLFQLTASSTRHNSGSALITAPAGRLVQGAVAYLVAPGATLTAIGSATVAYTYEAYAVNLNHKPTPGVASIDEVTRFTNYPFDKIVRYRNSYFGVAADGLYLLEGTTDDGTPIEWNVQTAVSDFGSPQKKTLVSTYLAGRFGSAATVDLYVGEKGAETYSYASPRGPDIQNFRQVFGRGVKARYFALGLSGTEEFQLDELDFETLVLSRRI